MLHPAKLRAFCEDRVARNSMFYSQFATNKLFLAIELFPTVFR